jgi:hypothetical protein
MKGIGDILWTDSTPRERAKKEPLPGTRLARASSFLADRILFGAK